MNKIELQINLHYSDKAISAFGIIKDKPRIIIVDNFPTLLDKVRSFGIKIENLILTFQPED